MATCKHLHTGWGSAVCIGALSSFKQPKQYITLVLQEYLNPMKCLSQHATEAMSSLLTLFMDVALPSRIFLPSEFSTKGPLLFHSVKCQRSVQTSSVIFTLIQLCWHLIVASVLDADMRFKSYAAFTLPWNSDAWIGSDVTPESVGSSIKVWKTLKTGFVFTS